MKKLTCIALACVLSAVVAGNASASKFLDTTENIAVKAGQTNANVASTTATTAANHPGQTYMLLMM